ncbi:MAG: hypothetical protein EOM11_09075, partial [Erysipelotrichia bacterium]|nr:hypothetical protein [Erysipelotrichia bacterium]
MRKTQKMENDIKNIVFSENKLGTWYTSICKMLEKKYHVNFTWHYGDGDNLIGKFYPITSYGINLILSFTID